MKRLLAEIKTAYRRLAIHNHPDRGGAHQRMVQINEAWEVLSDNVTRAAYDKAWATAKADWSSEDEVEPWPQNDSHFATGHAYWIQMREA